MVIDDEQVCEFEMAFVEVDARRGSQYIYTNETEAITETVIELRDTANMVPAEIWQDDKKLEFAACSTAAPAFFGQRGFVALAEDDDVPDYVIQSAGGASPPANGDSLKGALRALGAPRLLTVADVHMTAKNEDGSYFEKRPITWCDLEGRDITHAQWKQLATGEPILITARTFEISATASVELAIYWTGIVAGDVITPFVVKQRITVDGHGGKWRWIAQVRAHELQHAKAGLFAMEPDELKRYLHRHMGLN